MASTAALLAAIFLALFEKPEKREAISTPKPERVSDCEARPIVLQHGWMNLGQHGWMYSSTAGWIWDSMAERIFHSFCLEWTLENPSHPSHSL